MQTRTPPTVGLTRELRCPKRAKGQRYDKEVFGHDFMFEGDDGAFMVVVNFNQNISRKVECVLIHCGVLAFQRYDNGPDFLEYIEFFELEYQGKVIPLLRIHDFHSSESGGGGHYVFTQDLSRKIVTL